MRNYKFLLLLCMLFMCLTKSFSQTYIDSKRLFQMMEKAVNQADFPADELSKVYRSFHINRDKLKADIPIHHPQHNDLSGEEVFEQSYPRVYMFVQVYRNEKTNKRGVHGAGTTFPISSEGHFIVNYHMIDSFGLGNSDSSKVHSEIKFMVADHTGKLYFIDSVVTYSREADLAIIKVDLKGDKIKPFALADDPKTGSSAYVLSHPRDNYYYFTSGQVARMTDQSDKGIFSRRMEITAEYAAGSNGGPIINGQGNLIGVVSLTKSIFYEPKTQKYLQMTIRETVPSSVIKQLLK